MRVAIVSGNANNGVNAGTFYWNLNNASSNVNRNIGARQVVNNIPKISSSSLEGIRCPQKFGRAIEELGLTTTSLIL